MSDRSLKILVYGDSYANAKRFDAGIVEGFHGIGVSAEVVSVSRPGYSAAKLVRALSTDALLKRDLESKGPFDAILVIAGVNDIILRRGAGAFASSMAELIRLADQISNAVFCLEIVPFDETADLSGLPGKVKHKLAQIFRDPRSGRVGRYRESGGRVIGDRLIEVQSFMPAYELHRFKDRIHPTDETFRQLAKHVGAQMARRVGAISPVR